MVKSEVRRALAWLKDTVLDDFTLETVLPFVAGNPMEMSGREAAIVASKINGVGEFIQFAEALLDKLPDDE
jgi:hypothetical protein